MYLNISINRSVLSERMNVEKHDLAYVCNALITYYKHTVLKCSDPMFERHILEVLT